MFERFISLLNIRYNKNYWPLCTLQCVLEIRNEYQDLDNFSDSDSEHKRDINSDIAVQFEREIISELGEDYLLLGENYLVNSVSEQDSLNKNTSEQLVQQENIVQVNDGEEGNEEESEGENGQQMMRVSMNLIGKTIVAFSLLMV